MCFIISTEIEEGIVGEGSDFFSLCEFFHSSKGGSARDME